MRVNLIVFKYFDNQCPHYLNEAFMKARESSSSLRNIYQKLHQCLCKPNTDQNALSFIGPGLWNEIPEEIKKATNLNTFKDNPKKHYLKVVSTTFLLVWFLSLKDSFCETRKKVFYFTSKALFVIEKIKV